MNIQQAELTTSEYEEFDSNLREVIRTTITHNLSDDDFEYKFAKDGMSVGATGRVTHNVVSAIEKELGNTFNHETASLISFTFVFHGFVGFCETLIKTGEWERLYTTKETLVNTLICYMEHLLGIDVDYSPTMLDSFINIIDE